MKEEVVVTFKEAKQTASRIEYSDARALALSKIVKAEAEAAQKKS
jgi:hypothetical protein